MRVSNERADPTLGVTIRTRPGPRIWSALEYACHVRDVFLVLRERLYLALVEECPSFAPMYRDERASLARYGAEEPADVGRDSRSRPTCSPGPSRVSTRPSGGATACTTPPSAPLSGSGATPSTKESTTCVTSTRRCVQRCRDVTVGSGLPGRSPAPDALSPPALARLLRRSVLLAGDGCRSPRSGADQLPPTRRLVLKSLGKSPGAEPEGLLGDGVDERPPAPVVVRRGIKARPAQGDEDRRTARYPPRRRGI